VLFLEEKEKKKKVAGMHLFCAVFALYCLMFVCDFDWEIDLAQK